MYLLSITVPCFLILGNFPYYLNKSDDIFYTNCPTHLYQPLTVWSSEISDCEYIKSACSGIGQVLCDIGNTTKDAKCGCDYKKGYVMNGQNKCCSPSLSNECFCHYLTCENKLQELDKGMYKIKKYNRQTDRQTDGEST